MNRVIRFAQVACTKSVVYKALKIALIVGTVLNIINQGDILASMQFEKINVYKFILTYVVPYSVTTYTAVTMKLEFITGQRAALDANLECPDCHSTISVKQNEKIPACDMCDTDIHWKIR